MVASLFWQPSGATAASWEVQILYCRPALEQPDMVAKVRISNLQQRLQS
jgi:hypothetical protein